MARHTLEGSVPNDCKGFLHPIHGLPLRPQLPSLLFPRSLSMNKDYSCRLIKYAALFSIPSWYSNSGLQVTFHTNIRSLWFFFSRLELEYNHFILCQHKKVISLSFYCRYTLLLGIGLIWAWKKYHSIGIRNPCGWSHNKSLKICTSHKKKV